MLTTDGSTALTINGSAMLTTSGSTRLTINGSAMLTTSGSTRLTINRVYIWSPIYRRPISITAKVRVNLENMEVQFPISYCGSMGIIVQEAKK